MKEILKKIKSGELGIEEAEKLLSYEDVGFAKIDHSRTARTGYPEVIYGEGKTAEHAADIFHRLISMGNTVICTRTDPDKAAIIMKKNTQAVYHEISRIVSTPIDLSQSCGCVAIATGGTADMPVAEEAAVVLELFGSKVMRLYDVGVAGVHRLLAQKSILDSVNCVIAVAGMEGALPSVISGLVKVPVIAVPTSVGYGANLNGITTLLAMLCSCASGVSVVNIDNGFGAAYQADIINKLAVNGGVR